MVKVIFHTRLGTFLVALIAGLSLALAIGAFAAVRSSDNSSNAMTKATASNENNAIATKLPDTAVMRVFAKAAAGADQLPGPAAAVVESFDNAPGVPEDTLTGRPQLDQARLVLSNVGPSGTASLYAVPTSKHLLCAVWYPDMAGGGCFQGFAPGSPVLFGQSVQDGVSYIWGFLTNDVKGVSIIEKSTPHPAILGRNAFYFDANSPTSQPTAIVVELANGTSKTIPLSALPIPGLR